MNKQAEMMVVHAEIQMGKDAAACIRDSLQNDPPLIRDMGSLPPILSISISFDGGIFAGTHTFEIPPQPPSGIPNLECPRPTCNKLDRGIYWHKSETPGRYSMQLGCYQCGELTFYQTW